MRVQNCPKVIYSSHTLWKRIHNNAEQIQLPYLVVFSENAFTQVQTHSHQCTAHKIIILGHTLWKCIRTRVDSGKIT